MRHFRNLLSGINTLNIAIILSLIILLALAIIKGSIQWNGDTPSYIDAWTCNYSHEEIDIFRTPIYPVLIGIGKSLFGEQWDLFPIIFQIIVFYICGIYFSRLVLGIIPHRKIAWITVYAYFLFYPIINSMLLLGTEVLSFSLVALWSYCVWRFLQKSGLANGILIAILTLISVMLRPSLLVLPIAIGGLAFVGLFLKTYRRNTVLMLLTLIPTAVSYTVYVNQVEKVSGLKSISVVTAINKYYMARQFNDIFPELLADRPDILEKQLSFQKSGEIYEHDYIVRQWEELCYMIDSGMMSYCDLGEYGDKVRKNHPDVWYGNILRTVAISLRHQGPVKTACNDLIVLLYSILFVTAWIALRKFSLINFLTLMIGGGSLLSVFLYSYGDYGRLMLPTTPYLILMGGQILDCLRLRPFRFNLRGLYPGN